MESLDELSKTSSGKPGFFKHVFNFDEESKAEMLNIVQYAVLALIPVVILNKLMQRFVPEADDEKGSVEITAEVLAQIIPHIPEATFKIFSAMNLYDIQEDPYTELYEYLKSLPNVIYSPAVDQAELIEHLQDAAFFIHPNIWEETFCVSLADKLFGSVLYLSAKLSTLVVLDSCVSLVVIPSLCVLRASALAL